MADHQDDRTTDHSGACLAAEVREALRAAAYVPEDIDVEVRDHAVRLSGTVKWGHQRIAAERAAESLPGVHVLRNDIRVAPRVSAASLRTRILAALGGRSPAIPTIDVDVDDQVVTLTGTVASYTERRVAEHAARNMPRVRTVRNRLRILKA